VADYPIVTGEPPDPAGQIPFSPHYPNRTQERITAIEDDLRRTDDKFGSYDIPHGGNLDLGGSGWQEMPFQVTASGDGATLYIKGGLWTRAAAGQFLTVSVPSSPTPPSVSPVQDTYETSVAFLLGGSVAAGWYYLVASIASTSSAIDELYPDVLVFTVVNNLTTLANEFGKYKEIAFLEIANDGGVNTVTDVIQLHENNINDFMQIPDSSVSEGGVAGIAGLGFCSPSSAPGRKGLLEDYGAYSSIVEAPNVAEYAGDLVMMYYDYVPTGTTEKKYARVDSSNFTSWAALSASIEIYDYKLQLYNFTQATATLSVDFSAASAEEYGVVVRRYYSGTGQLNIEYLDGSTLKVADSALADYATRAGTADFADYAYDGAWPTDHGDLTGLEDNDHTQYWTNSFSTADQWDGQNTAHSGQFTNHMRADIIYSYTSGGSSLGINVGTGFLFDTSQIPTLYWVTCRGHDTSGVLSYDWNARRLIASNGTTVILDWSSSTSLVVKTSMTTESGEVKAIDAFSTNTTLDGSHHIVQLDGSSNAVTATLPGTPVAGQEYKITCIDATFTVTIARNGNNLFGAAADYVMAAGETQIIHYNSTNGWW
jgi:hypothetical protein